MMTTDTFHSYFTKLNALHAKVERHWRARRAELVAYTASDLAWFRSPLR